MRLFIVLIAFVLPVSQLMALSCRHHEFIIKRKSGKIECEKCELCPAGEEPVPACERKILNIEGEFTKGCRICSKGMYKDSPDGEPSTKKCRNCNIIDCREGFREIETCNVYKGKICSEDDCDLEHYKQNDVCKKCCQCEGSLKVEPKCKHTAKRCSSDEFNKCADLPRTTTMASTTLKSTTQRTTKGRMTPGRTTPATSTETKIPGTSAKTKPDTTNVMTTRSSTADSLSITTPKRIASTLLLKTTPYTQIIRLSTAFRTRKTTKKIRTGTIIIFPSTSVVAKDTSTSKIGPVSKMSRDAENSRNVSLTTVVPAVLAVIVIIVILICLWCSRKKDLSQCFLGWRGGDIESGRRRDRDGLSEDGIPLNQHNTNGRSFSGEGSGTASPAEDQKLLVNIPPPEGGAWNKPPSVSDHVDRKENDQESASPAEEQKLLVDIPPEEGNISSAWNKPPSVSDHVDRKENDQESASPAEEQKLLVDIPPEEDSLKRSNSVMKKTEDETLTQKIEVTAKNLLKLKLCCECGAKADQSIDDENRNIGAQIQQLKLYKKDLVQIYRYITRDLSEIEIHDGWALTRGIVAREPNASCAQLLGALQIMGRKGDLTRYHEEFHSI
ncbi:uncharacterized protein LOC135694047 isoform X2 [Rhopilema esculentum]|uniref:uncharacterized protein LOC135694047 isoform X2 n=1 Tax=Rhopilema esculentum TaxID=499914 RepID=UPI0031D77361